MISTSDIAYVLTIVKNGKDGWDEKMKRTESEHDEQEQELGMYMHVANVVFYFTRMYMHVANVVFYFTRLNLQLLPFVVR
jgi:hypothetical protein